MKNYNYKYIDIHYALIEELLFNADKNILDISYNVNMDKLIIQIVLLKGHTLSDEKKANIKRRLIDFDISIKEFYLNSEQFNKNKGEWKPIYYDWLDYLLFSKAETE